MHSVKGQTWWAGISILTHSNNKHAALLKEGSTTTTFVGVFEKCSELHFLRTT